MRLHNWKTIRPNAIFPSARVVWTHSLWWLKPDLFAEPDVRVL